LAHRRAVACAVGYQTKESHVESSRSLSLCRRPYRSNGERRGRRRTPGRRASRRQARARAGVGEDRGESALQARSSRTNGEGRRSRQLRREWRWHPVRPAIVANDKFPRSGGRAAHYTARSVAHTSTGTQHGGQGTTLLSIITHLLHFGVVIVGLDYSSGGQMTLEEITGGSPYGALTNRWRRWLASTDRERTRGIPLSGPQDRGDRQQAARLNIATQI
jgi:hypothetical protein